MSKRRLLGTGLGLLAALAALRLAVPHVALRVARAKLSRRLNVAVRVGGLDVSLLRGRVVIHRLRIPQPAGFRGGPFLDMPRGEMRIRLASLFTRGIRIREFVAHDTTLTFIRNADGRLNTDVLGLPPSPEEIPRFPLWVETLTIRDGAVNCVDWSTPNEALLLRLRNVDGRGRNLTVDRDRLHEQVLPGTLAVTAEIAQRPWQTGRAGLYARVGILGGEWPAVNAAVLAYGLELQAFSSALPPGAIGTLGGECLDLCAEVSASSAVLACAGYAQTVGGRFPFTISGTPDSPDFSKAGVFFGILSRTGGGLGSLARGAAGATLTVAETAVDTTVAVAKGAGRMAGSVGRGLLDTARGVVTADLGTVAQGLLQATVGTVSEAVDAVGGTAETVAQGAAATGEAAAGAEEARRWRQAMLDRWSRAWAEARKAVDRRACPGFSGTREKH
ncbi:MAG: hypothetical protein JXR37_25250 [Kiritimatiellae bacterium]|nr:hypothetical protein [Kiritimatiellia bacterium]